MSAAYLALIIYFISSKASRNFMKYYMKISNLSYIFLILLVQAYILVIMSRFLTYNLTEWWVKSYGYSHILHSSWKWIGEKIGDSLIIVLRSSKMYDGFHNKVKRSIISPRLLWWVACHRPFEHQRHLLLLQSPDFCRMLSQCALHHDHKDKESQPIL